MLLTATDTFAGFEVFVGTLFNDTFTFVLLRAASAEDIITHLGSGQDRVDVSAPVFGGGLVAGGLDAALFRANTTGHRGAGQEPRGAAP